MKDLNCKIVQDLLPNYIEKLTNQETNKYIEEHINTCESCKDILNNMKREIEFDNKKQDKREVKYIKKFNNKMLILKSIITLIILSVIIFIIANFIRKFAILKYIEKESINNTKISNYSAECYRYSKDNHTAMNVYYRNGESVVTHRLYTANTLEYREAIMTRLKNEKNNGMYLKFSNGDNIAILTSDMLGFVLPLETTFGLEELTFVQFCKVTFLAKITTENVNGKNCYKIQNLQTPNLMVDIFPTNEDANNKIIYDIYVDKSNATIVKTMSSITSTYIVDGQTVTDYDFAINDYFYKFDVVTDADLVLPNIDEYKVQENN